MRDAAAAAAMSDPENNRWFKRRWSDVGTEPTTSTIAPVRPHLAAPDDLDLLGRDLLLQWRRERTSREDVR